jgi:Soluble lytic murein transglycosylase and related regulatory proteins (some contain LysM/invasin domains)
LLATMFLSSKPLRRPGVGGRAALVAAALSLAAVLAAPASAQTGAGYRFSSPTEQYLAIRGMYPPQAGLNLDVLARSPAKYRGMTMELEGRLTGIVRSGVGEETEAMLMLATDANGTVSLTMSSLPSWVQPGERLRVLVVATGGAPGSVEIGIPDMEVVAVASALDVGEKERAWARRPAPSAPTASNATKKTTKGAPRVASLPRGTLPSRSAPAASARGGAGLDLAQGAAAAYPAYRQFIRGWNPKLSERQVDDITTAILRFSGDLDLDPRLVVALVIAESDFNPGTTSRVGAMGLGQLMPVTFRELQGKMPLTNPYDPVQNLAGSIYLLRSHLDKYSGGAAMKDLNMKQIVLALAAYNAGPGAVKRHGGVPPYRETQNYVRKISAIYKALCGDDAVGE